MTAKEIELKEAILIKRNKPRDNKLDLCSTSDKINCNKVKKAKQLLKKPKKKTTPKKKAKKAAWQNIKDKDLPF